MKRHVIRFLVLWAVLAAVGEVFALQDFYPVVGAKEADDFDGIFRFLLLFGMPVFAFVVAAISYSFFNFRTKGAPAEGDAGPTMRGTGVAPRIWLAITGSLAIFIMIHPGLTGLAKLQSDSGGYGWGDENSGLVINVTGYRYAWQMEYEGTGVTVDNSFGGELVLPVDHEVSFKVNSADVIHSFWIPAFRLKIDAIPGRTTFFSAVPSRTGSFENDEAFRVQCAELCGADHSLMRFPIRIVEFDEFETWLANLQSESGSK